MKKKNTTLAAILAAAIALTGCQSGRGNSGDTRSTTGKIVVEEPSTTNSSKEERTNIYAYGKENIPELAATVLTALGSRDEETYNLCLGGEWEPEWDRYKAYHEFIYTTIEKAGGDPTQDLTCADFTVYKDNNSDLPYFIAFLKGYEDKIAFSVSSKVNDIDKQEYYVRVIKKEYASVSGSIDGKTLYEHAQEKAADGTYTLIDLSEYAPKEDADNE